MVNARTTSLEGSQNRERMTPLEKKEGSPFKLRKKKNIKCAKELMDFTK